MIRILRSVITYSPGTCKNINFYRTIKLQGNTPFDTQYFLTNDEGKKISFWNDVPINMKGDIMSCCIEVPKEQNGKLQVKKQIQNHPFMQDTRKNIYTGQKQLRYYAQFPLFNYGFIPQTWEQDIQPSNQGMKGDNDPIDVCQLSLAPKKVGQIFNAKVLGGFCLIDQGEIDWKIIMLQENQCKKHNINDISDISSRHILQIIKWFKQYKLYDGKKANTIAYNEKIFKKDEILEIVQEVHLDWKRLINENAQPYKIRREQFKFPSNNGH